MDNQFRSSPELRHFDYEEVERLVAKGRALRAQAIYEFLVKLKEWVRSSFSHLASHKSAKRNRPHIAEV